MAGSATPAGGSEIGIVSPDFSNNHRMFGPIGHFPPAEAEAIYYAAIDNLDMVA